ncbi:MAG: hypothetical protein AAGG44_21655 [Planctomycetota bacterium]
MTRHFKSSTGMTPLKYRERFRGPHRGLKSRG